MAAGYLDLLQRELRFADIHPVATLAELAVLPGVEGQIASTNGSFYIYTLYLPGDPQDGPASGTGAWVRILNENDIAAIIAVAEGTTHLFVQQIDTSTAPGQQMVSHGFLQRPIVELTDLGTGSVIAMEVLHDAVPGALTVKWDAPGGLVRVTCIGADVPSSMLTP